MNQPSDKGQILVVEDDGDTRESLRFLLEMEGYAVVEATNGREALDWLTGGGRPCLILLDLMMPVMTGLELLAELRTEPRHASTPVVLVTAWPEQAAEAAGVQGWVKKPFELPELFSFVRRYCVA